MVPHRICGSIRNFAFFYRRLMPLFLNRSRLPNFFHRSRIHVVRARRSTVFNAKDGRAMELIRAFYCRIVSWGTSVYFVPYGNRQFSTITVSINISAYRSSLSDYFLMANYSICLSNGRRVLCVLHFRHVFRLNKIGRIMFSNVTQTMSSRISRHQCLFRYYGLSVRKR